MRRLFLVTICGLVAAATAWAVTSGGAQIGAAAPAFQLQDFNGNTVKLADFSGKILVLEWTNPECPFVQRHYNDLKTMITLRDKYKDQGVAWVAINSTRSATAESNKKWSDEHALDYPILDDTQHTAAKAYGAHTTPHMFIIDKTGVLVYKGAIDNDPEGDKSATDHVNYVDQALTEVLAGKPVSVPETKSYGCGVH